MTFNIISDLHILSYITYHGIDNTRRVTDWGKFEINKLHSADYLLIAGDIGTSDNYEQIVDEIREKTSDKFKDVFFIRGNHDYWFTISPGTKDNLIKNRYIEQQLDNNTVLLGCTLWTSLSALNKEYHRVIECMINDYKCIPNFTADVHDKLFIEDSQWLRDKCKKYSDKKIIVMTHHSPRRELVPDRYKDEDVLNYVYHVMDGSCDDIKPDIWISGHTHTRCDKVIDGTRFIRNPIGYHGMRFTQFAIVPECSPEHWYNNIVTL